MCVAVRAQVDFIWANTHFAFEIFRHSANLFTVAANGSLLQAKLERVPGGSFVCSFAGESHKFHYDHVPGERIRMTLDGKVVMLEKEKDPSVLTAPYAGKLTRYVVDDGAHLNKGEAYAEVEVTADALTPPPRPVPHASSPMRHAPCSTSEHIMHFRVQSEKCWLQV